MIIVCDLDRTLLPNGHEPDNGSLERFYDYLSDSDHTLIYATGRNIEMVRDAYHEFGLRVPDYLIAAVGTMVYHREGDGLMLDPEWKEYVYNKHSTWNRTGIITALENIDYLTFQEEEVQNEFKISLYVKTEIAEQTIREDLQEALRETDGIEIIYSIDPHKEKGLVDILPATATKLGALEYLRNKLDQRKEDVLYAGDSGNDILPLTFGYKAVLVKNAPDAVKQEVAKVAEEKSLLEKVYIATGDGEESGYYASGVIEGIKHFL